MPAGPALYVGPAGAVGAQNGWTLAEDADEAPADGMRRLLNEAVWDADEVRDGSMAWNGSATPRRYWWVMTPGS